VPLGGDQGAPMKIHRLLPIALASLSLLLLADAPARAELPSVLDGLFPVDSSAFPGLGVCQADGVSGSAMTPFGWYAPPCHIDPNVHFDGNPQVPMVVLHVQGSPIFSVPEPGVLLLAASGLAGLLWMGRRPRSA